MSDAIAVRVRMPLEEVTIYCATTLKNGKVEIFWDTPQREVCVRALFPQLGHAPCWYVRRRTVRLAAVSPRDAPREGRLRVDDGETFAAQA